MGFYDKIPIDIFTQNQYNLTQTLKNKDEDEDSSP